MKRILLDENIDRLLKGLFAAEFEVMTVSKCAKFGSDCPASAK